MKTAREAALAALAKHRRSGGKLDELLAEAVKGLSPRDTALAMRLCYGVVQNRSLIDLALRNLVKKTQPQVTDILRMGTYQLWYLDRVPRYALVSEAVESCKRAAPHAAGMVNAVLKQLPEVPPETDDLPVKYSLPPWFCEKIAAILPPEELEPFFAACNAVPPVYTHECPWDAGCTVVADPAAKLCVDILSPKAGERVWDVCAAPGGKTALAAFAMGNKGFILATDKSSQRLAMIRQTLARCGVTNTTVRQADAAEHSPGSLFDAVLCDVPCSGFGVLRKKPDIRYRTEISHYPGIQSSILRNAARAVKDGGALVYCTCTVFPEENEGVVEPFLRENSMFELEQAATLWPHKGDTDGFFICRMRKI